MKIRGFEVVSQKELDKSFEGVIQKDVVLPFRKTTSSAGYDFHLLENLTLQPGEEKIVKTGIKAFMLPDEVLSIVVRSSLGFKYNVRMMNQIGIIDSDYYNNPSNEGHIMIALQNHSENTVYLKKGEGIAQGIFQKYLIADGENAPKKKRSGGIGSTNDS